MHSDPIHTHSIEPQQTGLRGHALHRREFLKIASAVAAAWACPAPLSQAVERAQTKSGASELIDGYLKYLRDALGIVDIKTVRRVGTGPGFVDVVIVSAGFKANQLEEFNGLCEVVAKTLVSVQPWTRYQSLVNVHSVFLDDKGPDVSKLNVSGFNGEVLGCDDPLAVKYSRYAANSAATVVLHNSTFSTASTGVWGVAAINKSDVNVPASLVHELGHGFAGLGDEYIQREGPFDEGAESLTDTINVTAEPKPSRCKWHYWTEAEWPGIFGALPMPKGVKVGNFEGAGWPTGIYRPEETCLMRCDRDEFCVVCAETMETNFFRYIDLFQMVEPVAQDLVMWQDEEVTFKVKASDLVCQPPDWLKSRMCLYLDGTQVASSEQGAISYPFRSAKAKPGVYQLGLNLNVQSDGVRRDFGFLSSGHGWRVTVMPCAKPKIQVPPLVTIAADGTVDVPVRVDAAKAARVELKMAHAPVGATLEKGRFKWKPDGKAGVWRVDFNLWVEQQLVGTAPMEIQVNGGSNSALQVAAIGPVGAVTGQPLKIQLKASGKERRQRLFETVRVPAGVELNRESGELTWTPNADQAGPHLLRLRVRDDVASREVDVVVRLRRQETPAPVSFCNEYIPQTLASLERLKNSPVIYERIFETLRLLRDRYGKIHEPALAEAKAMYPALDPKLQENCLQELYLHAWQFAANAAILAWIRQIATSTKSAQATSLLSRLDEIDRYNAKRINGKPS